MLQDYKTLATGLLSFTALTIYAALKLFMSLQ